MVLVLGFWIFVFIKDLDGVCFGFVFDIEYLCVCSGGLFYRKGNGWCEGVER